MAQYTFTQLRNIDAIIQFAQNSKIDDIKWFINHINRALENKRINQQNRDALLNIINNRIKEHHAPWLHPFTTLESAIEKLCIQDEYSALSKALAPINPSFTQAKTKVEQLLVHQLAQDNKHPPLGDTASASTDQPLVIQRANSIGYYDQRAIAKLVAHSQQDINSLKYSEPHIESQIIQDKNTLTLKSSGTNDRSIRFLLAKSAVLFYLKPIIISGGNYQQQMVAMQEALQQGFIHIEIVQPLSATPAPPMYHEYVNLIQSVSSNNTQYHEGFAKIAEETVDNARIILHKTIGQCITAKNQTLYQTLCQPHSAQPPNPP